MRFQIYSKSCVLPGGPLPAFVEVRDGVIGGIHSEPVSGCPTLDVGEEVLSPGIVDTHAHLNEPGRTEWEGFETATRAAASAGITTIVDMPLNCIPATTSVGALEEKRAAVAGKASVDYGFWGGVIPGNASELTSMVRSGVLGFKAFLIDSGVSEFPAADEGTLLVAMKALANLGVPLLVHAELDGGDHPLISDYASYVCSRPETWEVRAVELMIRLSEATGCIVHIVHLSSAQALIPISRAKERGIPISVETCPHYLLFVAEEVGDEPTYFKCAPPIRNRANRESLWEGLKSAIDCIVSDHSPCSPTLKAADLASAWGGIAGLQFSLPAVWTQACARGHTINDIARWMSSGPARLAGLSRKGSIEVGKDADLISWNPVENFVVTENEIHHRHRLTPYLGRRLQGRVKKTWVRGQLVFDEGRFTPGLGREIKCHAHRVRGAPQSSL